jgi:hypothetical protein
MKKTVLTALCALMCLTVLSPRVQADETFGYALTTDVVYGIKSPVKAAFSLSPAVNGFDLKTAINSPDFPALLVVQSQFDIEAILQGVPDLVNAKREAGLAYSLAWISGFGHFYPTGAVSLGDDGFRISLGEGVAQFLENHLKD